MTPAALSKLRKKYSYVLPSLPDGRDIMRAPAASMPRSLEASLSNFRGEILDQKNWGSCTGHGTAGMLNMFYKRLTNINVNFNPYWIWYWARQKTGNQKMNVGAYPRDVFDNLIKIGVCESTAWTPTSFDEDPPKIKNRDIIKFKGYKRFNLKQSLDKIQSDFFQCISVEKLPIGITMAVHASFETYTKATGKLPVPSLEDPIVGYHWVYVDGMAEGGIYIVNSWSTKWGDNGTCFMPWEYFKSHVVEAWSLDPELP